MPRIELKERPADLSNMTIPMVEELVGRKPVNVEVEGKWVVVFFSNPDVTIRFKQW